MANKVLSIKMDERDIEKLNNYYEALAKAGILSKKDFSKNAFYKHMLLDHIGADIRDAIDAFNQNSGSLYWMDEEALEKMNSSNPYGLSKKCLGIMKKCYADVMKKRRKDLGEAAAFFEKFGTVESIGNEGGWVQLIPLPDNEENFMSFWMDKLIESSRKFDEDFSRNEFEDIISMVEKSNVSSEDKAELINELREKRMTRMEFIRKVYGLK